ncbi:MAG: HD domain-containing protein [Bacteroidales bacterium]|nr:HD domain-containing protein [Bacteroidales bacterium]
MDFHAASRDIIQRLRRELNPSLTYHSVEHTLDVLEAARWLSNAEKIGSHAKILIETASLYHDAGMIIQYKDHESASVILAKQTLPGFGFPDSDIDEIARLIMVTKLPQRPYDHLEQIICDADLDYLGRDDFFIHSFNLKLEWQVNEVRVTTLAEWCEIQINFLTEHQYFTKSASLLRNEKKLKHLAEIQQLCRREESIHKL